MNFRALALKTESVAASVCSELSMHRYICHSVKKKLFFGRFLINIAANHKKNCKVWALGALELDLDYLHQKLTCGRFSKSSVTDRHTHSVKIYFISIDKWLERQQISIVIVNYFLQENLQLNIVERTYLGFLFSILLFNTVYIQAVNSLHFLLLIYYLETSFCCRNRKLILAICY